MELYPIGQLIPLRDKGEHFANARVVRKFQNDEGEQMMETELIELASGYVGKLKLGAKLTFPEDGYVGTFENPSGP